MNNTGAELLIQEKWDLAERIFEYALGIPENLVSTDGIRFYYLVNLCIALKFGGKEYSKRLHSVDWSPFHPKFHLAVAVLEDRFDDAVELMKNQAVLAEITEAFFKDWPLFREFRNTERFQQAFEDIFHKELSKELLVDAEKELEAEQSVPDSVVM